MIFIADSSSSQHPPRVNLIFLFLCFFLNVSRNLLPCAVLGIVGISTLSIAVAFLVPVLMLHVPFKTGGEARSKVPSTGST